MAAGEPLRLAAGALILLAACEGGFLPLRGRIEVGRDPMLVLVAGPATAGDLYALTGDGGRAIPITFSPVAELRPALSPDGRAVAFLRAGELGDSVAATVWVMDLTTGRERQVELPSGAGRPEQVGWDREGRSLIVRAGGRLHIAGVPPGEGAARPVAEAERPAADSALAVLLGDPVFARAAPCANPADLCVGGEGGSSQLLAAGAREPVRWGPDSVAYFAGDELLVRPVGAGRARVVKWSGVPARPRQPTRFAGGATPAGPR